MLVTEELNYFLF